jgi:hypothetical protein
MGSGNIFWDKWGQETFSENVLGTDPINPQTFVDATNNAETVCYNLIIIRYVRFAIDYRTFFHFFKWAAKLLEEDILKDLNNNPDDLQSKNPGIKYLKLKSRLMAMCIDISFNLPNPPPERICIELSEGVWLTNDDEMLAYEKKKKSGEIPIDPTQN